jgi:ACS family glucarate transporter-like MFS transporter
MSITNIPPSPLPLQRPSHVRYLVVALAALAGVLLYLDRFCLSFCTTFIGEDLGLSTYQLGWLLSAFFWTYALAQVPSGWLSDRYGARLMLAVYILGWSLFTGLMGLAAGFAFLIVCRLGTGLGQAGAYPTSANLLSKWVPFRWRAFASGLVATGGRIGGAAAPVLTAYLMVLFVPATHSSTLTTNDLLDPAGLCVQLHSTEDSPEGQLSQVLRNRLPGQTVELIQRVASTKEPPPLTAQEQRQLVKGLNEILEQGNLYDQIDPAAYALEREAKGLAHTPAQDLTPEQITRRNRLLLEAAYPKQVGKIYTAGWRPTLIVFGLAGLAVAGLFWLVVRNRPQDHPRCNPAEVALIEEGRPAGTTPHGKVDTLPIIWILLSPSLWLSSISQFATNFGWVFLVLLLPQYLTEVYRVPVVDRGWLSGLPILMGAFGGMALGGLITDLLTRWIGVRWGRGLPMSLTRFLAMGAYLAVLGLDSPYLATVAFCVVAIATDLGTGAVWAFMQDVGGRHVGSILGWGNMWGNLGAAVSPIVLTWIVDPKDVASWNICFLACAGAFAVSGITALGVDARIPIVPSDAQEETHVLWSEGTSPRSGSGIRKPRP